MRVGVDIDGVLYPFAESVADYLRTIGRHGEYPAATRWEFYEDWGLSLPEFLRLCHDGVDAGVIFHRGAPFPGTVAALNRIRAAGHTIHFGTDRSFGAPGASAYATYSWLGRYGFEYDSVTFTTDKTILDVDVMIDDKPENYLALKAAGIGAYLQDRAWNAHVPNARRVSSLAEFAEVIG